MAAAVGGTIRVQLPRSRAPNGLNGAPARDPLACAKAFRSDGNSSWDDGDIENAINFWERACSAIDDARGRVPKEEVQDIERAVLNNLSQGLMRLNRFEKAKARAVEASQLDGTCIKTQYRLAEACVGLGEWKEAEELFAALEATGHVAVAARGRRNMRSKQVQMRQLEREFAAKMFASKEATDEKVPCETARPLQNHADPSVFVPCLNYSEEEALQDVTSNAVGEESILLSDCLASMD